MEPSGRSLRHHTPEIEEDEPSIVQPRRQSDQPVLAEIEPVAELETEGAAESGGDLLAVLAACVTHRGHSQRRSAVSIVAGADACRGGWVAIVLDDGRVAGSLVPQDVRSAPRSPRRRGGGAIDIPIGLPSEGVRAADVAARAFVGPRRSSVFPTPPRAALVAATYADILPSLSAQSFPHHFRSAQGHA